MALPSYSACIDCADLTDIQPKDADTNKSARIAGVAQFASRRLDADRVRLYFDLIWHSLSEAARRELQTMKPFKYEYQSDLAKHDIAVGRAELVTQPLTARVGELPKDITDQLGDLR